jgi:hypothetical protein
MAKCAQIGHNIQIRSIGGRSNAQFAAWNTGMNDEGR